MVAGGFGTDEQPSADLGVGQTLGEKLQNLEIGSSVKTAKLAEDDVVLDGHVFTLEEFRQLGCDY